MLVISSMVCSFIAVGFAILDDEAAHRFWLAVAIALLVADRIERAILKSGEGR